nr:trichohyalin-like [Nothobranchius furzeri]
METIIYQEEINMLNNFLTTDHLERYQDAKVYFFETIRKMGRASQVVIKALEDEQKAHNETKRNYERTTETLKGKDCLIISLQEGIATGEAKVLAAEQLANDYKQMLLEEQKAHQEMRRSYSETVNTLIENNDCLKVSLKELSESNQTSDLSPTQVEEIFQRGLEKAKSSKLEPKDLIISNLQSQNKALCVQIQHSTSDFRKGLEETRKGVMRDLQELNAFCLGLEEHFQSGIASYKQQVEFLEQELEKEKASHAETRETQQNIILTIQAEKEALRLQTMKAADEIQRQFAEEKRQLEENLEQKDVLYQSLDDTYRAELSDVKQQMENLSQELEEEKQIRKEREEMIFTIQAEKDDLCSQMQQQTSDLNKLHDETTRNFIKKLEEKDVLYQSLEQKCETQLSERHQLIESLKQELDTKRQQHFDELQETQAQNDAIRLQTMKAALELGRQFEQNIRQLEENQEQKDVLYQSLDDTYRAELSESRQQVEHLHRELEKEVKARKEKEEMIRIVQDEKVELYNQMADKARAMEGQFETEKRNFMKDLEEREVSCQDLERKYKTEVFNSKRQQQEMEKEREEAAQTILTIQSEKEALRVQMAQQLDVEKSTFQKELNNTQSLYRDLRKKYMELFFVAANSC